MSQNRTPSSFPFPLRPPLAPRFGLAGSISLALAAVRRARVRRG